MMLALHKPRPKLLEKRARQAELRRRDQEERVTVRRRSGGRCEIRVGAVVPIRCNRRASENHHRKGGYGRRNRGDSILAANRLHVCSICHTEVTNKVLRPVSCHESNWAETVTWERLR